MAKKEEMIFIRGRWEIATIETNGTTGKRQWIRRDQSYICDEGAETERVPMPAKPKRAAPFAAMFKRATKGDPRY